MCADANSGTVSDMTRIRKMIMLIGAVVLLPALVLVAADRAGAEPTRLDWQPCPDAPEDDASGMECAALQVPVDWAEPDGRELTLQLGRLPSTGPEPAAGSVLVAYGGPGGPGLAITRQNPGIFDELRRRMDVITWDTRGYGAQFGGTSTGLDCIWSRHPTPHLPADAAELDRLGRQNLGVGYPCRSRDPELFDHLSSADQARDMEAIRVALGEPELNFYGASYAGLYGQTYARLFPDRVRTLVLDGTFPHAVADWEKVLADQARRNEVTLGRFFAWCAEDRSCALHGRNPERTWRRVVARADREPLPATRDGVTYHYDGTDLRGLALGRARQKEWPALARAIRSAERGDASGFLPEPPNSPYPDVPTGITECTDLPRFTDHERLTAVARRLERAAPNLGAAGTLLTNSLHCVGWPAPVSNPPEPLPAGLPPLLGAGAWDESDAIVPVLEQVPGSALIRHEDAGHTLYQFNECARRLIDAYFVELAVPERETVC